MVTISRVGAITTAFGESPHWDDRRNRLYFVDCGGGAVYWLEADETVHSVAVPSMPTGLVLAEDGSIVVVLDDGLYVIDPDSPAIERIAPYPDAVAGRFNDAAADDAGNIVAGSLNFEARSEGSLWQFSSKAGWRHLADSISNVNGPAHLNDSLLVADTHAAAIYAFDYDADAATASNRRVFARTNNDEGPDGATVDAGEHLWSAMYAGGMLRRFDRSGAEAECVELPFTHPTSLAFGGENLDTIYVTTVNRELGGGGELAGALVAITETGHRGRPDPRFRL